MSETWNSIWKGIASWSTSTKFLIFGALGFIFLLKVIEWVQELLRIRRLSRLGMGEIDELSGYEFEEYVQQLLERLGYKKVRLTAKTNDYGIDVTAISPEGQKIGIQCKRYKKNVGIKAVQEAHAGKNVYGLDQVYVYTNSFFTPNAQKTAKANNVKLVDRNQLLDLIEVAQKLASD